MDYTVTDYLGVERNVCKARSSLFRTVQHNKGESDSWILGYSLKVYCYSLTSPPPPPYAPVCNIKVVLSAPCRGIKLSVTLTSLGSPVIVVTGVGLKQHRANDDLW